MRFFVGLHQPSDAQHFERCLIAAPRLRARKSSFKAREWLLDSGGFAEVFLNGDYLQSPEEYATLVRKLSLSGRLLACFTQDYACDPRVLQRTGCSILEHQTRTIERFKKLRALDTNRVPVLAALQGETPGDFATHVRAYGALLEPNAWVGVGSITRKSRDPVVVAEILKSILCVRPDLRLHAFGLKSIALAYASVRNRLHSGDSSSWSMEARKQGRNSNDWNEAAAFVQRIEQMQIQQQLVEDL